MVHGHEFVVVISGTYVVVNSTFSLHQGDELIFVDCAINGGPCASLSGTVPLVMYFSAGDGFLFFVSNTHYSYVELLLDDEPPGSPDRSRTITIHNNTGQKLQYNNPTGQ